MVLVWLGLYPHGCRQIYKSLIDDGSSKRQRLWCTLPHAESWLGELCRYHNIQLEPPQSDNPSLHVHALLNLQQGKLIDTLCHRSPPIRVMLQYYQNPLDAFSLNVAEVWPLSEPKRIYVMQRGSQIGGNTVGGGHAIPVVIGTRGVVFSAEDFASEKPLLLPSGAHIDAVTVFANHGYDANDVLSIPILCVPDVVGYLVKQRVWRELCSLGRWQRLFPEWPTDQWIEDHCNHHQVLQPVTLSSDRLDTLAGDLRAWSTHIVASTSADVFQSVSVRCVVCVFGEPSFQHHSYFTAFGSHGVMFLSSVVARVDCMCMYLVLVPTVCAAQHYKRPVSFCFVC